MLGNAPFSFVIPELPAEIRFLRREGNLELYKGGELGDRVERAVRTHSGPIFLMFPDHPDYPIDPLRGATSLGLEYDEDRCFMLDHNRRHFPIKVCRVQ
jgi:hypothetical protein